MALEMVLNELSLQTAANIHTARGWMEAFIQSYRCSKLPHRVSRVIRTKSDIFDITLAEDYPLRRWLNDQGVDLEMRRYIRVLTTKAPFWEDLPDLYDNVLVHMNLPLMVEMRKDWELLTCLGHLLSVCLRKNLGILPY